MQKSLPSHNVKRKVMISTKHNPEHTPESAHIPTAAKDRSTVHCVVDAWKIFALNAKTFLHFQWRATALAACATALLIYALMLTLEDTLPMGHASAMTVVRCIAAFLLFIPGFVVWKGCLFAQIKYYNAHDNLPDNTASLPRKSIWKAALRTLAIDILLYIPFLALMGGICALAHDVIPGLGNLCLPLFLVFAIFSLLAELRHVTHQQPLGTSVRNALTCDMKSFGSYFVIALLTAIPACCVILLAMLPSIIIYIAWGNNLEALLAGDPDGMPSYVYALFVLLTAVGTYISLITVGIQIWALALKPLRKRT